MILSYTQIHFYGVNFNGVYSTWTDEFGYFEIDLPSETALTYKILYFDVNSKYFIWSIDTYTCVTISQFIKFDTAYETRRLQAKIQAELEAQQRA